MRELPTRMPVPKRALRIIDGLPVRPLDRSLLHVMAIEATPPEWLSFQAIGTLASRTGRGRRTIQIALRRLCAAGVLEPRGALPRRDGGLGPSIYILRPLIGLGAHTDPLEGAWQTPSQRTPCAGHSAQAAPNASIQEAEKKYSIHKAPSWSRATPPGNGLVDPQTPAERQHTAPSVPINEPRLPAATPARSHAALTPPRQDHPSDRPAPAPASIEELTNRLGELGVAGDNLHALASAPGLTLAIIDEEWRSICRDRSIAKPAAVLYKRLARRFGVSTTRASWAMREASADLKRLKAKARQGEPKPLTIGEIIDAMDIARQ